MMKNIFYEGQVIWSQIDANRHLRHSAYADFCAQARVNLLNELGLSMDKFAREKIGPILFREELIYLKEVRMDEHIKVSVELQKIDKTNGKFSFKHIVYKEDGREAAHVHIDGAWLNLAERKLTNLPHEWYEILNDIPKIEDYTEIK